MRWLACRRVRDWAQGTVLLWLFLLLIVPAVGQSDSRQTEQIADTPLEQLGNVRVYSASKH